MSENGHSRHRCSNTAGLIKSTYIALCKNYVLADGGSGLTAAGGFHSHQKVPRLSALPTRIRRYRVRRTVQGAMISRRSYRCSCSAQAAGSPQVSADNALSTPP